MKDCGYSTWAHIHSLKGEMDEVFIIDERREGNQTIYIVDYKGTKYVTWRCVRLTDYYYGHYIESLDIATRDLYERAKEEIEFILSQMKEVDNEN